MVREYNARTYVVARYVQSDHRKMTIQTVPYSPRKIYERRHTRSVDVIKRVRGYKTTRPAVVFNK